MKTKTIISAAVCSLMLTSCATIFSGAKARINFNSNPPGASVSIDGNTIGQTPISYKVKKGFNPPMVAFKKDGYEPKTVQLQNNFCVGSIFNFFNPIFWIIDIADGAVMNYNPKNYNVELDKSK